MAQRTKEQLRVLRELLKPVDPAIQAERRADHERLVAITMHQIRDVRAAIAMTLTALRSFQTQPWIQGTDSHHYAVLLLNQDVAAIESALERIPRCRWLDGTRHENPPTYYGTLVSVEHSQQFITAMEWLRPNVRRLRDLMKDRDRTSPLICIPEEIATGFEREFAALAFADPQQPKQEKSRTTQPKTPMVKLGNHPQITIEGESFALTYEQAHWLKALIDVGDWMSDRKYKRDNNTPNSRPDRLRKDLPVEVLAHIVTTNIGSRWL